MYATYTYKAGSTAANILADVIKLLTGTTDKATLSGDCVQASTEILTTASVAGWTVYDAAAGTNHQVLRAPWHTDNGSGYNYIGIDTNTAGYVHLRCFESWNNVAHTGTNEIATDTTSSNSQRLNVAAGGILYISAQSGHSCLLYAYQSGAFGSSSYVGPTCVFERTRRSAWDTNANAYPVLVWAKDITTINGALVPRIVNASGIDAAGLGCEVGLTPLGPISVTNTSIFPDSNKLPKHLFLPVALVIPAHGFFGGDVSMMADFWVTTYSSGAILDEVANNGNNYIIWSRGGTFRFAVRKG